MLISLIAICLTASCVRANVLSSLVDDGIYSAIDAIVNQKYKDKPEEERECISNKFRSDKVAEKFYTRDLLFNNQKLQKELDPYFSQTETYCEWLTFAQTPLGICLIVAIAIMLLSLLIGLLVALCRCICC